MKRQALNKAAEELNELLGLDPIIDVEDDDDLDEKENFDRIAKLVAEAGGLLEADDDISAKTEAVLKDLGVIEDEEETEEEETEEEETEEEEEEKPAKKKDKKKAPAKKAPAKKAPAKKAPVKKAAAKKEKKPRKKSNQQLANELLEEGASEKQILKAFKEVYGADADDDWVKARANIYMKIAKKNAE
jgi:outer membrane biosynthesis protein TonB